MLQYLYFAILALILGFKHSYDADHLIAVSSILRKVDSLKSSIKVGFNWAVGHMITATIITMLLYFFKSSILNFVLPHFEKVVGVMLIILGLISLKDVFKFHFHMHRHGNVVHSHPHIHAKSLRSNKSKNHSHWHMFGIGIVHGLASNDELLVLFTASLAVTTIGGLLLGIGIFSIGVVLGMIFFSCMFSYPLLKLHSDKIYKFVSLITGLVGIFYGTLMIFALV